MKLAALIFSGLLPAFVFQPLHADKRSAGIPNSLENAAERFKSAQSPQEKIVAVQTLGEMGGPKAGKILMRLYKKETDPSVRRSIVLLLTSVLPEERESVDYFCDVALEDKDGDTRLIALSQASLLAHGDGSKGQLRETCLKLYRTEEQKENQMLSAIILRELGERSRDISALVIDGLAHPSVEIRRRAAAVLDRVNNEEALRKISAAAEDSDPEVRANLCRALGGIKRGITIPLLKKLAKDYSSAVRKDALVALSVFDEEDSKLETFIGALKDEDADIRIEAVGVLEKYENPKAVPFLEEAAEKDPDPRVQQLAKKALIKLKS